MFYTIIADGIKQHFCDSWILAQQVLENLNDRYPGKKYIINSSDETEFRFDIGGGLYRPTIWSFPAQDYKVSCYVSHWGVFCYNILSMNSEKYENKFFKLHSYKSVLCMSPASYKHLQEHLQNNKDLLDVEADRVLGWDRV